MSKNIIVNYILAPLSILFVIIALANIGNFKDKFLLKGEPIVKNEYFTAVDQLVAGAEQAEKAGKYESEAWLLNDAAYVLIRAHQCRLETNLPMAKEYLVKASVIKEANKDCKTKIKSNMQYVDYWLKEALAQPPANKK